MGGPVAGEFLLDPSIPVKSSQAKGGSLFVASPTPVNASSTNLESVPQTVKAASHSILASIEELLTDFSVPATLQLDKVKR